MYFYNGNFSRLLISHLLASKFEFHPIYLTFPSFCFICLLNHSHFMFPKGRRLQTPRWKSNQDREYTRKANRSERWKISVQDAPGRGASRERRDFFDIRFARRRGSRQRRKRLRRSTSEISPESRRHQGFVSRKVRRCNRSRNRSPRKESSYHQRRSLRQITNRK